MHECYLDRDCMSILFEYIFFNRAELNAATTTAVAIATSNDANDDISILTRFCGHAMSMATQVVELCHTFINMIEP